ncbi:hypothetical protein Tco_0675005 [Tanacetum coccineum]
MINNDDDSDTRIEPRSHKENPEVVDDDEVNDKEKQDEKKDDDAEKTDDIAKEKDNDDYTDPLLVVTYATEELTELVSPTTATASKSKSKRGFTSNKKNILSGSIAGMCRRHGQIRTHIKTKIVTHEFFMGKIREVLDHCNNDVLELTFAKTNEILKKKC